MNRNIEAGLATISGMMRDTQEVFDDLVSQWKQSLEPNHATNNALEMNKKLARALAYYYTPTAEEYRYFDEHSDAIFAAGGRPPNEELYWSELAFYNWQMNISE